MLLANLPGPASAAGDAPPDPALRLLQSPRPLVIGHRGYPAVAPENTLASFERALAAGVDLVELDYHHSRDGIPVVIHDGTLDRTTDALRLWGGKNVTVGSRTVAELGALEAGGWFQPPYPGQRMPTLDAALGFIQRTGVTLIERKGGDPATLVRLLRERALANRVVVQSFDWEFLRGYHALDPGQVLGALGPPSHRDGRKLEDAEKELDRAWIDAVRGTGARVVVWNRQVGAPAVRLAHELGLRVWVYTINEPGLASRLLADGVDGLITDNPPVIWRALALHALPAAVR